MKILCKVVGGSHMYGLNTPESDYDERYIFIHDDIARTIGLDRFEHHDERGGAEDKFGFELRHYMNLLRKTNTQVLEIVYATNFIEIDPLFKALVVDNRHKLTDIEKMYKSLRGYIFGEKALANGERTGTLGKRKDAIDKYGFSPKNFCQLFRIAYTGIEFFSKGVYPINIMRYDKKFAEQLLSIKLQPGQWEKEVLNRMVDDYDNKLKTAFENRVVNYKFDEKLANEILLEMYYPIIKCLHDQQLIYTN